MTKTRTILLAALACATVANLGCKPPPEAPTELSELSTYLFREWDNTEEGVAEVGLGNLYDFFDGMDLSVAYEDRAYTPADLDEEDIAGVVHPGRDPSLAVPVSMITDSAYAPEAHATVIVMEDQTPVEPASPDLYVREFVDPTPDPDCFLDRSCEMLYSMNEIMKQNAIMDVVYDMHKDWRWAELYEPGSGQWCIMGRSWIEEPAIGDAGNVAINQSFSIDIIMPDDDGGRRYMSLWPETLIEGISEDVIAGTTKWGMDGMFEATEEYLEENH
jgi:hypothetical protein